MIGRSLSAVECPDYSIDEPGYVVTGLESGKTEDAYRTITCAANFDSMSSEGKTSDTVYCINHQVIN